MQDNTADTMARSVLPPAQRLELFESMQRVRRIEERIIQLYAEQQMRCPTHFSIGQEAAASGVAAHLRPEDYVISAHRSHAHYLTKGGSLPAMMAELYGKATGCAGGKGGSMHLIDLSVRFLGCVPIVGSTIPIGVGASFGATLQGDPVMSVVYFGDGATETGLFHESMNFAALHKLPVLFVCENNLYSVNTPMSARQPEGRRIVDLASSHGMLALQGDGQDIEAVHALAGRAVDHIRAGEGPAFLELMTYRWLEHCGPLPDLHLGFRPDGEYESWAARCPLRLYEAVLKADAVLDDGAIAAMNERIDMEINTAVDFAKRSPFPSRQALQVGVYA